MTSRESDAPPRGAERREAPGGVDPSRSLFRVHPSCTIGRVKTDAPNFSKTGRYPLAGERIGPAWREAWKVLASAYWTNGTELSNQIAMKSDVEAKTVKLLLWKAEKAGILDKRIKVVKGASGERGQAEYRVSVAWMNQNV